MRIRAKGDACASYANALASKEKIYYTNYDLTLLEVGEIYENIVSLMVYSSFSSDFSLY